jgi:hypothetical protein
MSKTSNQYQARWLEELEKRDLKKSTKISYRIKRNVPPHRQVETPKTASSELSF